MERYQSLLRRGGLRLTPKRHAILEYFLSHGKYASPEEVWCGLRPSFGRLGLPTIYRNLEQMRQLGILVRVRGDEDRMYYALCSQSGCSGHHHHIVCRRCHSFSEVDACMIDQLKERIEGQTGFKLTDHELQLGGICGVCRQKEAAAAGGPA